MKYITLFSLLLLFSVSGLYQTSDTLKLELVESIPIETNLDNSDIRNTTEVWTEMIDNAKTSLDIEQFYISDQKGEPLEVIINAILSAAVRGVRVRIIVDSKMYKTYPETVDMFGKQKNVSVRIIDFGKLAGGIQHAKYFITDDEEIFLGSQNFDWRALKHIHEIGLHLKNKEIVKIYKDIFDLDWKLAEQNDPANIEESIARKNYQIPILIKKSDNDSISLFPTVSPKELCFDTTMWDEDWILHLIDEAKNDIYCQFLTYSPIARGKILYPTLDNALRRAAIRGVKVSMIVSDWSIDHPAIEHLKSLTCIPNIEVKFSAIPEWSGGYVSFARVEHSKYLVIDSSSCWIGTSNWEKSYFYNCRNLGIVIKDRSITKQLRGIFNRSWDGPYTTLIKSEVEYAPRKHGE
jgi:phosphatidylserine/phosphatidylglycerophosphate/cardiolipin synthase-like enzyme